MSDGEQLAMIWGEELAMDEETIALARKYALRAWYEYPVNRTTRANAAGSLYLAGHIANDKRTQEEISDVTDVNTHTIRDAYRDILQYEHPDAHAAIEGESSTDMDVRRGIGGLIGDPFPLVLTGLVVIGFVAIVLPHLGMTEPVDPGVFSTMPLWQHVAITGSLACVVLLIASSLVAGWPLPGSIGFGGRSR